MLGEFLGETLILIHFDPESDWPPVLGVLVTWGIIVPNVPDINHLKQDAPLLRFQDIQLSVAERAC